MHHVESFCLSRTVYVADVNITIHKLSALRKCVWWFLYCVDVSSSWYIILCFSLLAFYLDFHIWLWLKTTEGKGHLETNQSHFMAKQLNRSICKAISCHHKLELKDFIEEKKNPHAMPLLVNVESVHYSLNSTGPTLTRTSSPISARGSACRSARPLVRGLLSDTRFSSRGCPLGMRACTRVLYMINLSLIHIWRCRRSYACRSRWSPYH